MRLQYVNDIHVTDLSFRLGYSSSSPDIEVDRREAYATAEPWHLWCAGAFMEKGLCMCAIPALFFI